jgi:hypothetical protein
MAGMNLSVGLRAGGMSKGGSYSPLTPASTVPASSGSNIGTQAFGIQAGTNPGQSRTAAIGGVSTGILGLVGLVFLWWSLPR